MPPASVELDDDNDDGGDDTLTKLPTLIGERNEDDDGQAGDTTP